jgi:hypothetical protein
VSKTFDQVIEYLKKRERAMKECATDSPFEKHWSLRAIECRQSIINLRKLKRLGQIDKDGQ